MKLKGSDFKKKQKRSELDVRKRKPKKRVKTNWKNSG